MAYNQKVDGLQYAGVVYRIIMSGLGFSSQKIKSLIQVGANNGDRYDDLNKYIKKNKVFWILVEPINIYFKL